MQREASNPTAIVWTGPDGKVTTLGVVGIPAKAAGLVALLRLRLRTGTFSTSPAPPLPQPVAVRRSGLRTGRSRPGQETAAATR